MNIYSSMSAEPRLELLRITYMKEALLAFKLFKHKGVSYYTCNVGRLNECNRLGEDKQVSLWRTQFFLRSNNFLDVDSVIFDSRPGGELTNAAKRAANNIFLKLSDNRKAVNVSTGEIVEFNIDIPFNQAD
jgi:hypothetical protein